MPNTVIKAEGLSKRYRIGQYIGGRYQYRYRTLRDVLADAVHAPFRRLRARSKQRAVASNPTSDIKQSINPSTDFIWALKDVSFEVKQGEVVGIIGRNGAGKTTLLKVLSRITEPTEGRAKIKGRIGTLLEVGTGFHPELTGRENIYLSGAILGMTKKEMDRKFDKIVDFSGIEKFIDTPAKRYSSGMWVRLGFAVAAHLEPEILLVDEVLAVGDATFQKKCLNKMQDAGQEGRTVLFISHNMSAITRLCERVILLDEGKVAKDGPSHQVVNVYLQSGVGTTAVREWRDLSKAPGNDIVRLRAVRVRTEDGQITDVVDIRRPVRIEMEYEVLKPGHVLTPNYHFYNEEGVYVFIAGDLDPAWRRRPRPVGRFVSTAWVPGNLLSEGTLVVNAAISTITRSPSIGHFYERDAVAFQVVDTLDGDSARGDYAGPIPGIVRPLLHWTTQFSPDSPGTNTVVGETAP